MIEKRLKASHHEDSNIQPQALKSGETALALALWQEFADFEAGQKQPLGSPDSQPVTGIAADEPEEGLDNCDVPPEAQIVLIDPLFPLDECPTPSDAYLYDLFSAMPLEIPLALGRPDCGRQNVRLQREALPAVSPASQRRNHHPVQPAKPTGFDQIDYKQLQNTSSSDSAFDRIAEVVSRHEGRPDSINWNDNGAGVSAGMFQANQKRGELPSLLRAMEQANGELFAHIFGQGFANLVKSEPEKIRKIEFTAGCGNKPNSLGLRLEKALAEPLFQEVQRKMLREKIVHAACVANEYGLTSERGVALVADLINQLGEGRRTGSSGARRYLNFARSQFTEDEKIATIVKHDLKAFGRAQRDRDIILDPNLDATGPFKFASG